jgi:hypothetical protein
VLLKGTAAGSLLVPLCTQQKSQSQEMAHLDKRATMSLVTRLPVAVTSTLSSGGLCSIKRYIQRRHVLEALRRPGGILHRCILRQSVTHKHAKKRGGDTGCSFVDRGHGVEAVRAEMPVLVLNNFNGTERTMHS